MVFFISIPFGFAAGSSGKSGWFSGIPPQIPLSRHFEASKSDPASVAAWESKLGQWGLKSLEKYSQEERKTESARREAGALAAKDAIQRSVAAGGELTIGPMVDATSSLSASQNMLMIAQSPSILLESILGIMEAAAQGDSQLKTLLAVMKTEKVEYGLRMTSSYKLIFEEELERQLPEIQEKIAGIWGSIVICPEEGMFSPLNSEDV